MTDMGEPDFPGREADFRFPHSKPTFKLRHYLLKRYDPPY
jgi:hypothetical protein